MMSKVQISTIARLAEEMIKDWETGDLFLDKAIIDDLRSIASNANAIDYMEKGFDSKQAQRRLKKIKSLVAEIRKKIDENNLQFEQINKFAIIEQSLGLLNKRQ